MAELSATFGSYQLDIGGMRATLKSGQAEQALLGAAEPIASACCSACYEDRGSKGHMRSQKEPFRAWTSQGGYTAIGHVSTVNLEGLKYEQKSKILESHNH